MNDLPQDLSNVQFRGPDPDKAAAEIQAAADAVIAAAAATAAQAKQDQINALQSQINELKGDIQVIKNRITAGVVSVGFNSTNNGIWNGRVNSWTPQQWHTNRNSSAFGRINRNMNRTLETDINNWAQLDNKIKENENIIASL